MLTYKYDKVVVNWALFHVLNFSDLLQKRYENAPNMSMYEKWKIESIDALTV